MKKVSIIFFVLSAMTILIATIYAADNNIGVSGSATKYPIEIQSKIADKEIRMTLTGVAMRKRTILKIYTIGSYIAQDANVHSAADIVAKDCAKQMQLVMERNINGEDMAGAFIDGILQNYPQTKFTEQKKQLLDFMKDKSLKTGETVYLTHVPGVGFECVMPAGKILIKDVEFAQAIWNIYFGKNNIGEETKASLTARLK